MEQRDLTTVFGFSMWLFIFDKIQVAFGYAGIRLVLGVTVNGSLEIFLAE